MRWCQIMDDGFDGDDYDGDDVLNDDYQTQSVIPHVHKVDATT